jgi:hypothetical protein
MRALILLIFPFLSFNLISAQNLDTDNVNQVYQDAYNEIELMLSGKKKMSFKRAVLISEYAYLNAKLDTVSVNNQISFHKNWCLLFKKLNTLNYDFKDKSNVELWGSIFKVMTDTIAVDIKNDISIHLPFRYNFDDFFGDIDWSNMFVSKLLETGFGNCHSLPYLYKILAEDMGTTAYLALAPNHIYIKHRSQKTGMFNTELTSATFPIDAWIMASGYIHLTAIQNGIYMKALTDKESIALCLIDLAEGYKRKTNNADHEFIIKSCNKALEYFPNCVNAMILKAETIKSQLDRLASENPKPTNEMKVQIQGLFNEMQDLYVTVHKLGYRQMPKDMYMKWLVELKTEKEKYQNKNVSSYDK